MKSTENELYTEPKGKVMCLFLKKILHTGLEVLKAST